MQPSPDGPPRPSCTRCCQAWWEPPLPQPTQASCLACARTSARSSTHAGRQPAGAPAWVGSCLSPSPSPSFPGCGPTSHHLSGFSTPVLLAGIESHPLCEGCRWVGVFVDRAFCLWGEQAGPVPNVWMLTCSLCCHKFSLCVTTSVTGQPYLKPEVPLPWTQRDSCGALPSSHFCHHGAVGMEAGCGPQAAMAQLRWAGKDQHCGLYPGGWGGLTPELSAGGIAMGRRFLPGDPSSGWAMGAAAQDTLPSTWGTHERQSCSFCLFTVTASLRLLNAIWLASACLCPLSGLGLYLQNGRMRSFTLQNYTVDVTFNIVDMM